MEKIKLFTLFLVSLLAISGIVVAQGEKGNNNVRIIAPTTSFMDKIIFRMKGCSIVHELNDATALKCPKNIYIEGAFEDKVYHVMDMGAIANHKSNASLLH